jgi:FixJ family two-component response regulator
MGCGVAGRPRKLIADEPGITLRTVEVHRARVFEKMDARSAVEPAELLRGRRRAARQARPQSPLPGSVQATSSG